MELWAFSFILAKPNKPDANIKQEINKNKLLCKSREVEITAPVSPPKEAMWMLIFQKRLIKKQSMISRVPPPIK